MPITVISRKASATLLLCVVLLAAGCVTTDDTDTSPTVPPTPSPTVEEPTTAEPQSEPEPGLQTELGSETAETPAPEPSLQSTATASPTDATTEPSATAVATTVPPVASTPASTPSQPTPTPVPTPSQPSAVSVLSTLTVTAEYTGSGYNRGHFEHDRRYLCDGSGTDLYTGIAFTPSTCDVEHVVAAKEAFESGAWEWTVASREAFGDAPINLIPSRDCVNSSKGAKDIAEWSGRVGSGTCAGTALTAQGKCFLALKTVEVKAAYGLSVDTNEKAALQNILEGCPTSSLNLEVQVAPVTIQPSEPTPRPTPRPTARPTASSSGSNCHPAYEPCLPNLAGDALNCGDLDSDQKPVKVRDPGTDPYRLDRDGDGRGCTG